MIVIRKLSYDSVCKLFSENNCELLDKTYKDNSTPMEFRCSCGGVGIKNYQAFKNSPRCRECSSKNSLKQLRVNKFNFNEVKEFVVKNSNCTLLSTEYKNNSTNLKFACACGECFYTSFAKFKDRNKRQCNECSMISRKEKLRFDIKHVEGFVDKNSNCTLISKSYINNSVNMDFLCDCGEPFSVSFAKFKDRNQRQCYECGQKIKNKSPFDVETVRKVIELEGCSLLSNEYVNAKEPLNLQCECGEPFTTSLDVFDKGKNRCDKCSLKQSKFSLKVERFLKSNKIKYEKEHKFDDCRNVYPLPFDYAIFDNSGDTIKCLIEVDGRQHFEPLEFFGGEEYYFGQIKRDEIKNKYCKENNFKLIRIPYFEENNVDTILKKHLLQ